LHISSSALGQADQAHAVVNAARAEATLGDLEAAPFAQQDVADGHAHVLEIHLHVAVGRIVIAHHVQRARDADALGIGRDHDHALLRVLGRFGVGLAHGDEDLAARIAGARDPPLVAVDDVFVALALDAGADVGGVGGGDFGLGHGEGRADLAFQQGLEPALLELGTAVAGNGLHIAGVRRGAVEDFGSPWHAAHDFGQRCVFLVGQARAVVARGFGAVHGQEQIPQACGLGLGLELFNGLQRRPALAGGRVGLHLVGIFLFRRVDVVVHELEQALLQVLGFGRVVEVHECSFYCGTVKLRGGG
jgi:hypothetical protein